MKTIYREGYYPDEEVVVTDIELCASPGDPTPYFRIDTIPERSWPRYVTEIIYDAKEDELVFHCPENF